MRLDRLATLLGGVSVRRVSTRPLEGPCFWVVGANGARHMGIGLNCPSEVAAAAELSWPAGEMVLQAGPFVKEVGGDAALGGLVDLLVEELSSPRCGAVSLISGYVDVLLVHVLREAIGGKVANAGLMAGLADPKLARAIVAMHERPAQGWSAETLADLAGMSRSGFMARFGAVVGLSPMAYLRQWRLSRAREDLAKGERVAEVARRYGYGNADAFARAFRAFDGRSPIELRHERVAVPA